MIDLHTHTTASDGRCTPEELVSAAAAAGVTTLAVTDHDTVAGCPRALAACERAAIEFVPGIEITSIVDDVDVHVLGYFIDTASRSLHAFLGEQRRRRVDRLRLIVERLGTLGFSLDPDAILEPALSAPDTSVGRPWIARALVAHGHAADTREAFDKWLGRGRPAFVPRLAAPPVEVFARIHEAGGVSSLAHPALNGHDEWIPEFAAGGLDAIEVYHTDHDPDATSRYLAMARRLGLAISGGSDYHADPSHGGGPGSVSLPREDYEELKARQQRT